MSWLDSDRLVQNSDEWHKFRESHIGASEVPAIMGVDDWKTKDEIMTQKFMAMTNQPFERFKGNWATERGKALEPIILSKFEARYNCSLTSPTLEYPEWKVMSASLDGYWKEENAVIECKAPAAIKHQMAFVNEIPKTYEDQIQAQLIVSGAKKAFYVSYTDKEEDEKFSLAIVEIMPDLVRQNEIITACREFWDELERKVRDYISERTFNK
jgi:putative phage-type endonuclease